MGPVIKKHGRQKSLRLHIQGRVQGVGFRPFIYRLAKESGLTGTVYNQPDGVVVLLQGPEDECMRFIRNIADRAPAAAVIKKISHESVASVAYHDFRIQDSRKSDNVTEVCPDIAICADCLRELYSENRRISYPFINCTNCGPRFTIIEDFPYDRRNTSMEEFSMCPACGAEFENPDDRRFHAQPISCPQCGPVYRFHQNDRVESDFSRIIEMLGQQIGQGHVVAIKGLGGYNLACDAFSEHAVAEMRRFKKRERKPFAVMFRSIEALKQCITVSPEEESVLLSWRKPIVIVNGQIHRNPASGIPAGLKSLGVFLPYLPLHHLLFDKLKTDAIVLTSGNESDIPILYREEDALSVFRDLSGGILINDRRIARRADDSVVRIIHHEPRIMRRARGYCPAPVDLPFDADGILATGAELSNTFCLGKGAQAVFSQHIGDLKNFETFAFFTENIAKFSSMYRFEPRMVACDMHPDYLSTDYARKTGLERTEVQHHHAHIASVMAEYGLNGPVIGVAYDGTGYGTDRHIWGSEVMIADYHQFKRISHFEYLPLPGGDRVTKEPWRTALSWLHHSFAGKWQQLRIPLLERIDMKKAGQLTAAMDKKINSPLCCSAGRLFDAIGALTGICTESNYHAEAPLLMENYLTDKEERTYTFGSGAVVSFTSMIREIAHELELKVPPESVITRFHNTVAEAALVQIRLAAKECPNRKVVLSGGTFQNKYLTEKLVHLLQQNGFDVMLPREISCNDSGIALGQLAVAAHKKH